MEYTTIIGLVFLNALISFIFYKMVIHKIIKMIEFVPVGTVQRLERSVNLAHTKINDFLENLENATNERNHGEMEGMTIEEMYSEYDEESIKNV